MHANDEGLKLQNVLTSILLQSTYLLQLENCVSFHVLLRKRIVVGFLWP